MWKKVFPGKEAIIQVTWLLHQALNIFSKQRNYFSLSLSLSLSLNHQHTNTPNYTAHNTLVALHLILSLSLHRIRLSNTRFLYDSLSMIHLPIATHFLTQQQRISYTLSLSISFVSLFCIYILAISLSSLSLSLSHFPPFWANWRQGSKTMTSIFVVEVSSSSLSNQNSVTLLRRPISHNSNCSLLFVLTHSRT